MTLIPPLHDRILLERSEAENETRGEFVLPDNAKEKPRQGKILAVGPGRTLEAGKARALDVKKDGAILLDASAGSEVKVDGTEFLILSENDVLAVIDR